MRQKSYERVSAKRVRFPTQKTDKSSECVNKYHARHSESLYPPAKRLEKALEFTGAMDHDKTSCLCIFGEKKSIYQRGQAVLFLSYSPIHIPSIVVTNWNSIVPAAKPSVVTLVVNISTCSYN